MTGMDSDKKAARTARRTRAQALIVLGVITLLVWLAYARGSGGADGYSVDGGDAVALIIGLGLVGAGALILDRNRRN